METNIDYNKLTKIITELFDSNRQNYVYSNTNEFTCFYMDLPRPIQIRDYIKLFNGIEYFWVEVILSKNFIKENELITGDRKKYIGRVASLMKSSSGYDFGYHIEFLECQVFELVTFGELLNKYVSDEIKQMEKK